MVYIFLLALGAAVLTFVSEIFESKKRAIFSLPLTVFALSFVVNWLLVLVGTPYFTHLLADGYVLLGIVDLVIAVGASLVMSWLGSEGYDGRGWGGSTAAVIEAVIVAGLFVFAMCSTEPHKPFDNTGNSHMAVLLGVKDVPAGKTVQDNDVDKLIKVSENDAITKARLAIGGTANVGSYLQVDRAYLKQVGSDLHPWWIVSLKVSDWRAFNSKGGVIPGYVRVDALNKDKPGEFQTGYSMRCVPGVPWTQEGDLDRTVYFDFLQGTSWHAMDLDGLEVTDDWVPMYTGTLVRQVVGFDGYKVDGVVTLDPQTCEIKQYSLGGAPEWVRRVYPLELIQSQANWWGRYYQHQDYPMQGEAGVRKVDQVIDAFTKTGQEYQITFTSSNTKDASLTDIITVDVLTGEAFHESASGATVEKIVSVMEIASKRLNPNGYTAVEVQRQWLLGREVWYGILETKPDPNNPDLGVSVGGYAFLQRGLAAEDSNVVLGRSLDDAYTLLRSQIVEGAINNPTLSQTVKTLQITGIVDRQAVLPPDSSGKSFIIFTLAGKDVPDKAIFRVGASNPVAALMRPTETVTVTVISVQFDNYTDVISIQHPTIPNFK